MSLLFKKLGVLFDPSRYADSPDWMKGFAQAPNAIDFGEFFRVYFCTRGEPEANNMYVSRLGYVDLAKSSFEIIGISKKPCLKLGGLGEFDEFGTYPVSVLKHNDEYFGAYGGWTRCESVPFNISIGMSKSNNSGITFSKFGVGPVLGPLLDEPFIITSPKLRFFEDRYVMTYTAGHKWIRDDNNKPEIIYKLRIAFSKNLIEWSRLGKNIISDKIGENEAQACGDIIFKNGRYHMFFCYRKALDFRNNPNNTYRIGYASSLDLIEWCRDDSQTENLQPNRTGWDSDMIAYPNVVNDGEHCLMFYAGNGNGKSGFGAAEIKGF
jgi:predicted GH43/DUF377 family glycosyl hydrolase